MVPFLLSWGTSLLQDCLVDDVFGLLLWYNFRHPVLLHLLLALSSSGSPSSNLTTISQSPRPFYPALALTYFL